MYKNTPENYNNTLIWYKSNDLQTLKKEALAVEMNKVLGVKKV